MNRMHFIAVTSAAALLAVALAGCRSTDRAAVPSDEAGSILVNRNWLDVWPRSKTEPLHVYRFTPAMGGGVFQDRTLFKGTFELFTYKVREDVIEFVLPHTGEKVRSTFRIERIKDHKPFDLRLSLDPSPRGPAVYYGMSRERPHDLLRLDLGAPAQ